MILVLLVVRSFLIFIIVSIIWKSVTIVYCSALNIKLRQFVKIIQSSILYRQMLGWWGNMVVVGCFFSERSHLPSWKECKIFSQFVVKVVARFEVWNARIDNRNGKSISFSFINAFGLSFRMKIGIKNSLV